MSARLAAAAGAALAILLPAAPGAAAAPPAPATADAEIARRAAALYERGDLQAEMPGAPGAGAGDAAGRQPRRRQIGALPAIAAAGGGLVLQALAWTALVVVALVVLFQVVSAVGRWRGGRGGRSAPAAAASSGLPAAAAGGDPFALARAGRYAEAVHLLLLAAIASLAARVPGGLTPGHTSREVARAARLGGAARAAFERLAATVERHLFAGQPLGAADWERCAAAFREIGTAPETGK